MEEVYHMLLDELEAIRKEAKESFEKAVSREALEELRIKYLGKKGALTRILRSMGKLTPEERKQIGQLANETRAGIEKFIEEKADELRKRQMALKFQTETIDVTAPGRIPKLGAEHPITLTIDEMTRIFMNMGFSLEEGPEVETVFMNFDALNAGPNHPSYVIIP